MCVVCCALKIANGEHSCLLLLVPHSPALVSVTESWLKKLETIVSPATELDLELDLEPAMEPAMEPAVLIIRGLAGGLDNPDLGLRSFCAR